ncbi:MAG TPA: hypothetical protein VEV83_22795 [Parafilimonas sp.]|jgi:hypothetical protein|nr:hypothetical protein [Parafilimonas sp.]
MTIFEYLKEPHPWVDLNNYTWWQVAMFFTGSVLWLVCYIDTIRDIRKKKTINIPIGCVVTNYGWEIAASTVFVPNMGKLLVVAYWAWMILDTYIFASTFRYGYKQCLIPFFKNKIRFYLAIGIVVSFITQATFMVKYDIPMAPVSGDIINLYMSVAFLYLLTIPGYEGNSLVTGWSKFLGTGIINLMFALKYPDNYFLISIGISCAVFDILYIVLLHRKKAQPQAAMKLEMQMV